MDGFTNLLNNLKDMGCSGIKISFEDEGALLNEMITMRYITARVGLDLSIKIGGCEAKRDIVDSIDMCCDAIVAPMVESRFSLSKFLDALQAYNYTGKKGFNFETYNTYSNIDTIIPHISNCDFVTFGRVDFVKSMDKDRNYVDSDDIFELAKSTFTLIKKFNVQCYLGGAISKQSYRFIHNLAKLNLLDKFETRYVIFDVNKVNFEQFDDILYAANLFEIEWLKFIKNKYTSFALKDSERIKMMGRRAGI
jgi:4-hydroxy-2-oxoheptanedioate aldolase